MRGQRNLRPRQEVRHPRNRSPRQARTRNPSRAQVQRHLPIAQKTRLRLAGAVPPEVWNRLGTSVLPKLGSGDDLSIGIDFSVSVGHLAQNMEAELRQILGPRARRRSVSKILGLDGRSGHIALGHSRSSVRELRDIAPARAGTASGRGGQSLEHMSYAPHRWPCASGYLSVRARIGSPVLSSR